MARDDRMSSPKSQKSRSGKSPCDKPTCGKCDKKHWGECLVGMGNYFSCGKEGHKVRYFPNVKGKDNGSGQASSSNVEAPKKFHFYALRSRGEQESSHGVGTGIFEVFYLNFYALLVSVSTFSFFTPSVARKFDNLPDILNEPIIVTTLIGESVVTKRVYRNRPIMFPNRFTHVELVELDMVDFEVILGMY